MEELREGGIFFLTFIGRRFIWLNLLPARTSVACNRCVRVMGIGLGYVFLLSFLKCK